MKLGTPFQKTFYNLHFELTRGKYIRYSEIAGTLIFLRFLNEKIMEKILTFQSKSVLCSFGASQRSISADFQRKILVKSVTVQSKFSFCSFGVIPGGHGPLAPMPPHHCCTPGYILL